MKDHALNQYPTNNHTTSFNILLLAGLVSEDERPLFAKYAEPDDPCFTTCLRARGYAIWHIPTKTRVFAIEYHLYRPTLRASADDIMALRDSQHNRPMYPDLKHELSKTSGLLPIIREIPYSYNRTAEKKNPLSLILTSLSKLAPRKS